MRVTDFVNLDQYYIQGVSTRPIVQLLRDIVRSICRDRQALSARFITAEAVPRVG